VYRWRESQKAAQIGKFIQRKMALSTSNTSLIIAFGLVEIIPFFLQYADENGMRAHGIESSLFKAKCRYKWSTSTRAPKKLQKHVNEVSGSFDKFSTTNESWYASTIYTSKNKKNCLNAARFIR